MWQTADALSLSLEGSTMDKLYEHMAGQISGFGTTSAADTKQIIALQDTIRAKQRQAEALQKKVRMEKRFAKQMQLNAEALYRIAPSAFTERENLIKFHGLTKRHHIANML